MSLILKMAFRSVRRNLRRTVITIGSIAFGLAVILWLQSILEGQNKAIVRTVTSTHVGHLQIYHRDYPEDRPIQKSIREIPSSLPEKLPAGALTARRIHLPALASSGEQSVPVMLEGVDPSSERRLTTLESRIVEGDYLSDASADCQHRQALIGRKLAQLLNVSVGNKIVLLAQAADGTLGNELLRVQGIFDTRSVEFDRSMVFAPLPCVSRIGAIQGVHELTIRLPEGVDAESVRGAVANALPGDLSVISWREALPRMNSILRYNDATLILISVILFVVITLGIINTVLVSVFERTREFGVMIALGTAPSHVIGMVVAESLFIGLLSAGIGIVLGLAAVFYHQKSGFDITPLVGKNMTVGAFMMDLVIYPDFRILPFLKSVAITLLFVVAAGVYPAYRASRLNPVEAMRFT